MNHSALALRLLWAMPFLAQIGIGTAAANAEPAGKPATVARDALVVLRKNCLGCHNPEKQKGGLVMSTREALLKGGDEGPVVVPGKASQSILVKALQPDADPHMPPKKQLSDERIALLKAWIDGGLEWDAGALAEPAAFPIAPDQLHSLPVSYRPVQAVRLAPDEKRLAVGRGNEVVVYAVGQTNSPVVARLEAHRDAVQSLAWSPDGKWLASGGFRRVRIWDAATLNPVRELTNLVGRATALSFTPDNASLIAADGVATQSGLVRVWSVPDVAPRAEWNAHADTILDLAVSADGKWLATAGTDKLVKLWELPSGKEIAKLEGHTGHVWALAFKPDGSLLASGSADKDVKIWDLKTKELKSTIGRHPASVTALAWSNDGKRIVSACEDGAVRFCQEDRDSPVKAFNGIGDVLNAVAVSSDGKTIYGGCSDGSVSVWNADGKQKERLVEAEPKAESALGSAGHQIPLSFVNDVLPVLSRAGCNAGKCHAKPDGQNGFKLSVFAYDPKSDYKEIVKDDRGRRIFPALPEESLILKKPTLTVPHEGGERFEPGSKPYETLRRWIEQGMPYSQPNEPALLSVEVEPSEQRYKKGAKQPLRVRAHFSNGSVRDVTDLAEFDSNDKEIARVDEFGRVIVGKVSGEAAVIARYMGLVAVSRITVPSDRALPDALYATLPVHNFIDELAYARFKSLGLFPSDTCTEAEFIRRASLDVTGTLPKPDDVRAFLSDRDPEKRRKLIDRLLAHPAYADHWAEKWADLIRPNPDRAGVKSVFMLDEWLRESFRENKPYDRFVREILTAQGSTHRVGATVVFRDRREPGDVTTLVSQVFLGVRMECARCHHHPNEKWSQDDFYQFAAYFGEIKRKGTGISPPISGDFEVIYHAPGGEVRNPVTLAAMKPKPLDAPLAKIENGEDPRQALADWACSPDNPFLARAVVNRVWAEFFGRGIVDPVDDFRASNPACNEPLLDALARDFVQHRFDLKHLMRTILQSHLYQSSSLPNEYNAGDARYFSRSYRRRLPAEVLLDAVADVTKTPATFQGLPSGARAKETWNYKISSEFLDAFGRPNSSSDCPCERDMKPSVVQALHLMNSNDLQNRLANPAGRAAQLAKSDRPAKDVITEIYLAAFSRYPTPEELSLASRAFAAPEATRQTATEDVLWALMNSAEFVFNH